MEKYQIIIGSPVNYDKLVAYIVINDKHIALINQEEGKDKLIIEFFDEPKVKGIYFDILIEALHKAKEELLK